MNRKRGAVLYLLALSLLSQQILAYRFPILKLPMKKTIALLTAFTVSTQFPSFQLKVARALEQPPYGLKEGRLKVCPSQSNCISTSSINSLDKYGPPFTIPEGTDPEKAWIRLKEAVENDSVLKTKVVDDSLHYIRAEAPSVFPPTSVDDVEFLMPTPSDMKIFYRSNSRDLIRAGQQFQLSDSGTQKKRLDRVQRAAGLGVMEQVTTDEAQYLEDFNNMNFFQKQKFLSNPADINFLDNKVPEG